MPQAREHVAVAAGLGVLGYTLYCAYSRREFSLGEAVLATGVCVLGSLSPDGLEPAIHPSHRSVAHSVTAGALCVRTIIEACGNNDVPEALRLLLGFFALGHVSHLVLDGGTPKGLPLLF
jgi:hypothetical protein